MTIACVKEPLKITLSSITCVFSGVELLRKMPTPQGPRWKLIAWQISLFLAKISLVLSLLVSRPITFLISRITGCFFSEKELEHAFGPNTVFAINPWHPRHILSIAALFLALPIWIWSLFSNEKGPFYQVIGFNILTSRPLLHIGNQCIK